MAKSWLQKYGTYEEEVVASAIGIIAFAGGGQANATQLLKKFNQIDINASANDSVKLVPALIGKVQGVFNNTSNNLSVFPAIGEYIDATINNEFVISPGDYVEFRAYAVGRWDSYAGAASGTGTVTNVSVSTANGFAGSVATSTTTPAITIRTTITGILVGNGTSVSAAVAGDFPTLNQNTSGNSATATALQTARTINGVSFDGTSNITIPTGGSGDVTSNTAVSVNEEIALFSGTSGKIIKRATTNGMLRGISGVLVQAVTGSDYSNGTALLGTGILKSTTVTGSLSIAVAGDFPTLNQNTSGTASNVTGIVAIANGGTGQATATLGFNALSPVTTRGDIIVRGATNNQRLALGAAGTILRSDGTDLVYTTAIYPTTTTVNQILYSTSANVIGGNANLTFDGTSLTILSASSKMVIRPHTTSSTFTAIYGNVTPSASNYVLNTDGDYLTINAPATTVGALSLRVADSTYLRCGLSGNNSITLEKNTFIGGSTTPTATLHLKAGTATANTAPLKLIAGTNLTTPENGAFEFDGTNLYFTTGGTRKTVTIV